MTRLLWIPAVIGSCFLVACGSDGPKTEQLQSITVTDANGRVTARTTLDYEAGKLVRVRAEGMTAGADNQSDTEDDVLGLVAAADCQIESGSNSLHDSYAEAHGISPVSIFFSAFQDCALPGLSASSIKSKSHLGGPDGKLLTADDTVGIELTLARTATGSSYTSPVLADTSCDVNCSGLDNIVYNPYAGLNVGSDGIYRIDTLYTTDSRSRLQSYANTQAKTIYTRNADGLVLSREFLLPGELDFIPTLLEEYESSAGKIHVTNSQLMSSAQYDSLAGSPIGQIMLTILGIGSPFVASDGLTYYRHQTRHYLLQKTGERLDSITQLVSTGVDEQWNTSDDETGKKVTLKYDML
ncbi:MAG: hypothetical protein ACRERR_02985 [Moraxellaceae bacterium]